METENTEAYSNSELIKFITEARARGFEDYQIRLPLLDKGWPLKDVERAFYEIKLQGQKKLKKKQKSDGKVVYVYKNSMTIHLDNEVMKMIEKRAKKNMLTSVEQVEDIVRRSCVNTKKNNAEVQDKVDDLFLKLFSRKGCGKDKKK
ncbi:MAG: hypothetical protein AABX17_01435 [Nanoarchaeota archaeon]